MELEHVTCYLNIQKIRLKDNLSYFIDIQESLNQNSLLVTKLILQPLVENAIVHGITPQGYGEIIVSIYTENHFLIYNIYDSGVGCDLQKIEKALKKGKNNSAHGRCIKNVNERIRLKFGKSYGLKFKRPVDGGTIVEVKLPILYQEKEDKMCIRDRYRLWCP